MKISSWQLEILGEFRKGARVTDVEYTKVIFATIRVEGENPEKNMQQKNKTNKRCNMYLGESFYYSGRQCQRQRETGEVSAVLKLRKK